MKRMIYAGVAVAALIAIPAVAQVAARQDGPMAGPLTRASVQAMVQARFAKVDSNNDGFVTQQEADARIELRRERMAARRDKMEAGGEDRQARVRERMSARFDRLDANKDGSISRAEYDGAMAARSERRGDGGPGMRRGGHGGHGEGGMARRGGRGGRGGMGGMGGFGPNMIERLDANRDGKVSLAEAQTRALAMFDRVDANRDGTITPEERRAARERFREARQDRRPG